MQKEKNRLMNISLPKLDSYSDNIEFQVIDMQTLFKIKIDHNLEYAHRLEFNLILIVVEGNGFHSIDFKTYQYKKGTVFFIKKGQAHSFKINPNLKCFLLQFSDNFLNKLVKNFVYDIFDYMRYPVNIQLDKNSLEDILNNINVLNNQFKSEVDQYKEPILQSLLQALLLQLKRERRKQSANQLILKDKEKKIYHEFLDMVHTKHKYSVKVEDYARALDISSKTLTNLLKKYTGKSTKQYLNEFLILQIKRYLHNGTYTIEQICQKLDFDEATNLVKFFKKYEKITPREYQLLNLF